MRDAPGPHRARLVRVRARRATALLAVALLLLAAGLALASCGSDDEAADTTDTTETSTGTTTTQPTTETTTTTTQPPPPPRPTEIRVRVVGGAPQGGIVRERVDKGKRVVVIVTSDVRDHVHVHGYDRFADVGPGMRARLRFRATIPGRFVIELEDRHAQIAELTVKP
jgi:hypothetical protein